jgi:predicted nucleotide-binding protein
MGTFHGSLDELKELVAGLGEAGEWQGKPNNIWRFQCRDRAGLNWSESKGTLWFDGPTDAKGRFEHLIATALLGGQPPKPPANGGNEKTIFVVHGHDTAAREQLELVLHKLRLEPFVLQNTDGGGGTILERLEQMIGKKAQSAFGIVLLTPDDLGYAKRDGEGEAKPRARQNVILELGMLLASLTRERVAILSKGYVEHPSDMAGLIYIGFNDHVKETVPKLASRLQAAGIPLDAQAIAHASA